MSDLVKTALVTGGSRGIGKACALRLAREGFQIYLTYVSRPAEAEAVVEEIANAGGTARAFQLDSSDREAVAAFFAEHIKGQVHLSALVNNAGLTRDGLLIRMKDDDWDRVIDVNLTGAFACLREAAKIMVRQRAGRIVNMASVVGQSGNAGQANYVASKSGLIGLTKTAALELASRGITVNAVAPGFITTDMTADLPEQVLDSFKAQIPLQRPGTPEDIAGAVAFLVSDDASYITGQVLSVTGGMYM
ncbi:3-oxoacyl-[acyl-carrier protein] reductase [Desulfobaculum xiamenense]|uniref:3-oxoacyl-[acyl-carrier-protein] reductase n=1 Tax=Desulfobaculum xiamenense TaxID=995050 RepID=A0A846QP90_9BACT|nr:3-oxoacyl-[acyl-carrier-protein] reductase [Desulfobaculum xiamenense]NJB68987.1 3-oxoacyl-[acyl-carrier protein] reductase [Desulfobaculum xiamenense]